MLDDFTRMKFLDALAAADIGVEGMISSPNVRWCPVIPYIDTYGPMPRKDGLWGPLTYTHIPTLYSNACHHFATIPAGPHTPHPHPAHLRSAVWRKFTEKDFLLENDSQYYGRARVDIHDGLEDAAAEALLWVQDHFSADVQDPQGYHLLAVRLAKEISDGLMALLDQADSIRFVTERVGRVQMHILELYGVKYYITDIMPNVNSLDVRMVQPYRGVIVFEVNMAQQFLRLGVPVWMIRRRPQVTIGISIGSVVKPTHWGTVVEIQPHWTGKAFHKACYDRKGRNTLSNLDARLNSNIIHAIATMEDFQVISMGKKRLQVVEKALRELDTPEVTTPPAQSASSSEHAAKKARGNDGRPVRHAGPPPKVPPTRAPRYDPSSPSRTFTPCERVPPLPLWEDVFRSIGRIAVVSNGTGEMACVYHFPTPWSLVAANNDVRLDRQHNYIRLRPFFVQRLVREDLSEAGVAQPLRHVDWVVALNGDYHQIADLPPTTDALAKLNDQLPAKETPSRKSAALLGQAKARLVRQARTNVLVHTYGGFPCYERNMMPVFLNECAISRSTLAHHQDSIEEYLQCELLELNFVADLQSLDCKLFSARSSDEEEERADLISKVWSGTDGDTRSDLMMLRLPDLWRCNVWTSDATIQRRQVSLGAFLRILQSWDRCPPEVQRLQSTVATHTELDSVCAVAIRCYVERFISVFNRFPIAPGRVPKSYLTVQGLFPPPLPTPDTLIRL